jgi:hypothetical protein
MKTRLFLLVPLAILFGGCLTTSYIAAEEGADPERDVIFCLNDGSRIESRADHHMRVERGYSVSGVILIGGRSPRKYEGVVLDAEIEKLGVETISPIGMLLGIGIGACAIAFVNCGLAR